MVAASDRKVLAGAFCARLCFGAVREGWRVRERPGAGMAGSGRIQTGHFRLHGGDLWQFAFLPHWDGTISRCVFRGPPGIWRVQSSKFCCEVILPEPSPRDSAALLAFLREGNAFVELEE